MARIVKAPTFNARPVTLPGAADAESRHAESEGNRLAPALRGFDSAAVAVAAIAGTPAGARAAAAPNTAIADAEAEARERGYKAGHQAALKSVQDEWGARVERLERVIAAFEDAQAESLDRAEDDAVAIAFAAISRMLGDKRASLDLIAEIVADIRRDESNDAEPIVVRVKSDDYEALIAEPFIIALEDEHRKIRLVEDPRVMLGGCIVETSRGSLDARIETQIDRLRKVLLETRAAGR